MSYQAVMGNSGLEGGIEYGERVVMLNNKITDQAGYTFLGWYTDKNYSEGSKVTDGDGILDSSPFKTETTLYAKWEVRYYNLGLDSNSNLTQYSVYQYNNDTNQYSLVSNDNLKFRGDTRLKIVMENIGISTNQNTFDEWSTDINYTNVSIGENRNIFLLTMPTQDIVVSANFTLNDTGFEFDNSGSTCILAQYFGANEVVNIPHSYNGKVVDTIGSKAFKKSNCKKIIITSLINKIQEGAFHNVEAEIFFEEGSNFNLISQLCFESENLVYLDAKTGYNIINGTQEADKIIRDLSDGIGFVLNGKATSTTIKTNEDFTVLNQYCYLYNIDYEIKYTSKITELLSGEIVSTITNYTSNMKVGNGGFFTQDNAGNLMVNFSKIENNADDIASLNSKSEYERECFESGDLNITFNKNVSTDESSYSKNPDLTRVLPVENREVHTVVHTSEQLLFAIENGYKPLFLEDCSAKQIYEKALTILRKICDDTMNDYQKTLAIHDYILNNTTIDNYFLYVKEKSGINELLYRAKFLEGSILDNTADRTTYRKTFSLLLSMEGIENQRYIGKIKETSTSGSNETNYVWNRVKLNFGTNEAKWYNAEIANDEVTVSGDFIEIATHTKFLISDADMTTKTTKQGVETEITYLVLDNDLKSLTSYRENYYINNVFSNDRNLSLYFEDINASDVTDRGTNLLSRVETIAANKNLSTLSIEIFIKGDVSSSSGLKEIFGATNTAKLATYTPNESQTTYTIYTLLYEF